MRALYCIESPESWFEDFGSGRLQHGSAEVVIDAGFAATVDTEDYFVFFTPEGDCRGLYVETKHPASFVVREMQGGASNARFSYRIVAKRNDVEAPRLKVVDIAPLAARQPSAVAVREKSALEVR